MHNRILLFLLIFIVSGMLLFGQEVSEKKEIAVFGLSYYDWTIPSGALGLVDQEINNVFINLGRFNVLGMTHRLSGEDINSFIDKIREIKEANMEVPENVRLGEVTFTEADFNKLVNSFIVVIPVMTYYNLEKDDVGKYKAEITTAFTFINVDELKAIANFSIETSGYDENSKEAVKNAVENIPQQLTFEIRSIPEFQLKTGIIDINGSTILVEFGSNMGLMVGDEYSLVSTKILSSGHQVTEETGLMIITDVKEEISEAILLYSDQSPVLGDQLKEIPRMGLDTGLYAQGLIGDSISAVVGIRQSTSRGFYSFRPTLGIEIPLIASLWGSGSFPLNVFIGGELNWYLWRLQVVPMIGAGVGMLIPLDDTYDYTLSYFGGKAQLTISYLLSRDLKLFVESGFAYWIGLDLFESYGGIIAGAGAVIKY